DEAVGGGEGVAEEEAGALQGAEQVADHREGATPHPGEVEGRPPRLVDPAGDRGHLQAGVDLLLDADQLPGPLHGGDTVSKVAVAHAVAYTVVRGPLSEYQPSLSYDGQRTTDSGPRGGDAHGVGRKPLQHPGPESAAAG